MLKEFLTLNRDILIARCRDKMAKRFAPADVPASVDAGVPIFLRQLTDILVREHLKPDVAGSAPEPVPKQTELTQAAALHGSEMLHRGFDVGQVVHGYGDVCQSVTELAVKQNSPISANDFRIFNRCLDDAIAGAVTAFAQQQQANLDEESETLQKGRKKSWDEQRRSIEIARQSYAAIKTGAVGLAGATGTLLEHALNELLAMSDRSLPATRLASGQDATTAE